MIDFNTEPYNDDYDENNKFYRILFRPSFAVQARELTQMQTILQQQVKRHGDHVFKQGAMVIPGQCSVDNTVKYIKVKPIYAGAVVETYINNLEGLLIKGESGLTAKVLKVVNASGSEPATLYVRYTNSGDDNETKTFADNEILAPDDTALAAYTVQAQATDSNGSGSLASIERGVYYVNGYFVLCETQTIVLDPYGNAPSYRIGLTINEQIITPEDSGYEMLLDNAQNSYNYAAPGAHRYYIDLVLTKLPLSNITEKNFIELLQVSNGRVLRQVRSTDYSVLEKTLARRTYDESGNYTVRNFNIDVREHRSNDRGQWKKSTPYLIGDVITNNGNSYVAKISGSSLASGTGPSHTSGEVYENPADSTGVKWGYVEKPVFNRGVFSAEGKVVAIYITSGGSGYTSAPLVTISGGGGSGALATAVIDSNGAVIDIVIDAQGSGYTSTPTVSIAGGGGSGATATATADFGIESKLAIGMEPGKAYVQGYEIEKIATEYVAIDKARSTSQVSQSYVQTPMGNFVYVTNLNALPPFDTFETVTIYDQMTGTRGTAAGSAVGTARVRGIEWDSGTIGTVGANYKLFLFDIRMNVGKTFADHAKSFYYNRSSNTYLSFTADVSPTVKDISGSVTTYSSYPTKGASTTLTGINTSFQTQLSVGDYIHLPTIGQNVRVTAINSQSSITIASSVTIDGGKIQRNTATVNEPQSCSLLFRLPNYAIKSVTDKDGVNRNIYYVMQYISGSTGSASGGSCTMTINTTAGVFASESENDNYIVMYADGSAGGAVVKPTAISAAGSTSITFTLDAAYASKNFVVMATIKKSGIGRKSKTWNRTTKQFNSLTEATARVLSLGKADVIKINSVKMKSGAWGSEGSTYSIDITDRYDFDNGQRETHYDIGTLILKTSYAPPAASIEVDFEYLNHGTGDYFTVDSYPSDVQYKEINTFNNIPLRDCIDFRPRINDAGTGFSGSGSSYSTTLKRGQDLTADYSYYLSRRDKIAIDFNGNFFDIPGVSSVNPGEPIDPQLGMVLYKLTLEPYTFNANTTSVDVEKVENKRYTMRDIGVLEKRIDNLEYYTALSLLEQDTKNLTIQDADGLDRFKNGFVTDTFTGHSVGNVLSPDYMCSIDETNKHLRPFSFSDNIPLVEKNTNSSQRASSKYMLYGDVYTLPLNTNTPHVELVKQEFASRLENINPFAVFTFLGNMLVNPSSDDWFEVKRLPDIVRNIEGNYNTLYTMAAKSGVLGTVWNSWQTAWCGTPTHSYYNVYQWVRPYRTLVTEVLATNVGQTRTGVNTSIVAKFDNQVVDDRVVSTSIIPYMRSRYLLVKVKGLKPNTRFYPYFDTMYVDYWATPSSYITYTLPSASSIDFDDSTNAGGDASDAKRRIDFTSRSMYDGTAGKTCLDIGDVITGSTSGISAVVVGKDYSIDPVSKAVTRRLHVVNIKSNSGATTVPGDDYSISNGEYTTTKTYSGASFTVGETIVGSISGAVGTVQAANGNQHHVAVPLVSNFNGDLNFLFWVPDYTKAGYNHPYAAGTFNNYQFRCGTREFKLVDASTYDGEYTSSARSTYSATGLLQTKQSTVNSVRNAELVQEVVRDNRVIVETSERVVSDTGWYDPLAQTFLVESPGGAFLSKIDIFFASKDSSMPVTLELREVVNGYPGKRVLPFSKVSLKPEEVSLSSNTVDMTNFDGSTVKVRSYDTATTFTFKSPVYVQDNQEYAIVLSSDSNNYKVWISQMGDRVPGTSQTISKQPYAGVFFKSQNASTWTADQSQDLKFTVWRAKFDTSVVGTVQFVNDTIPSRYIENDPFQTVAGSNLVRVWHQNHGLFPSSKVTFSVLDQSKITDAETIPVGKITCSTSTTAVSGSGTYFQTLIGSGTIGSGTVIYKSDGTYIGVVASVSSETGLTLKNNAAVASDAGGSTWKFAAPINGIPVTEIFTQHSTIANVDLDSYTIQVTTNATSTGYSGGENVKATSNIVYDVLQPSLQIQNFSDTKADFYLKTTSGRSVDGGETPYTSDSGFSPALLGDNNYFDSPRVIASADNSNVKTMTMNVEISSTNDALSPVIDTARMSAVAISNRMNAPTEGNINVDPLDIVSLFTGATGAFYFSGKVASVPVTNPGSGYTAATVSFSAPTVSGGRTATGRVVITNGTIERIIITDPGTGYITVPTATFSGTAGTGATLGTVVMTTNDIVSNVTAVRNLMKTISVGKYINVSGATTTSNSGDKLVTGYVDDGSLGIVTVNGSFTKEGSATGTTVKLKNLFIDDISPVGSSSYNKYVSKIITLEQDSTFMKIKFAANVPAEADVAVYYKTSPNGDTLNMDTVNWVLADPVKPLVKVENGDPTFYDVEYDVENLTPFDAMQVKLVMKSTNSSAVPLIKDLRIIACA